MERHEQRLAVISTRVKSFHDRKLPFRIYHGSTHSTRIIALDPDKIVDISDLIHVIEINVERKTALVEANVPMDKLVEATLKYGLLPPVVPEFPGITAGGAFSGTAGESSSFRDGFFDRTVNWVEMVLANGETVKASPAAENADLFYGAIGACGTLGVTTLLEVQLMEAGKFVELTYRPVSSVAGLVQALEESCVRKDVDFVDGILFTKDRGVLMTGRLAGKAEHRIQRFARAHDPWFYLHADTKTVRTESVPVRDYLFRYDRGAFWTGMYSFDGVPFNRLTRWIFNPLMNTRKMYEQMHHNGHAQHFIIQDLALPTRTTEKFIDYVDDALGIYPLWLCPLRTDSKAPLHRMPGKPDGMAINIGVWGPGPGPGPGPRRGYGATEQGFRRCRHDNRALEAKVGELGGLKWLYAHAYYTPDEFWAIHDRPAYDAVRQRYHAGTLPCLYDKVKAADRFTPTRADWKSALRALVGTDHLLLKKAGAKKWW